MEISNLLLIPGAGETASFVFRALRYEKTVRLFSAIQTGSAEGAVQMQHRITPVGTIDKFEQETFPTSLKAITDSFNIKYIIPTTEEARRYFKTHGAPVELLDTSLNNSAPPDAVETTTTLDGYTDKDGKLIFYGSRELEAQVWRNKPQTNGLEAIARETSATYQLRGAWSLSVAQPDSKKDVWRCSGMSDFISPEMTLFRALGVNFPLLALHDKRGNKITALPNNLSAEMCPNSHQVRLQIDYDTVFLDFDDTLILHGALNDTIMAFLHQCQARKVAVYLITRHYQDPTITLTEYGVSETLFTDIIWITDSTPKSQFMKDMSSAIFVDDAFSERSEVSKNTTVPCITPDAVEALISCS